MRDVLLLLKEKYQVDLSVQPNSAELNSHIEKALRNAAVNGFIDDLKTFLKVKGDLGFNIDGVAGNGKIKTALHHSLSHDTIKHVECTIFLIDSGANLFRLLEAGLTEQEKQTIGGRIKIRENAIKKTITPEVRATVDKLFNGPVGKVLSAVEDSVNASFENGEKRGASFFSELNRRLSAQTSADASKQFQANRF